MNQFDLRKILYYISLFLLGTNYLLFAFFKMDGAKTSVRIAILLLLVFCAFLKKGYTFIEYLIFLLCSYLLLLNGNLSFNIVFAFMIGLLFEGNTNNLYRIMNVFSVVFVVVVLLSLYTGLVPNVLYVMGSRIRNTLGFFNVNAASLFFFSFFLFYLSVVKKIILFHVVVCMSMCVFLYVLTDSRTPILGLIAYVLFRFLLPRLPYFFKKIIVYSFVCLMFISPILWLTPLLNNSFVNNILSERSSIFFNYISHNTVTTFLLGGSNVREVDNFYLLFLFNGGIFTYLFLFSIVFVAVKKILVEEKYLELAFVCSILSIGLMESSALRSEIICMSVFWIIIIGNSIKEKFFQMTFRSQIKTGNVKF